LTGHYLRWSFKGNDQNNFNYLHEGVNVCLFLFYSVCLIIYKICRENRYPKYQTKQTMMCSASNNCGALCDVSDGWRREVLQLVALFQQHCNLHTKNGNDKSFNQEQCLTVSW